MPIELRSQGATNTPALNLEEQTGTMECPFYNSLSYLLHPIGCFIHPPVKAEGADSTGSKFQGHFGDLWSNLYTVSLKCTLPTPHKTIRERCTSSARGCLHKHSFTALTLRLETLSVLEQATGRAFCAWWSAPPHCPWLYPGVHSTHMPTSLKVKQPYDWESTI